MHQNKSIIDSVHKIVLAVKQRLCCQTKIPVSVDVACGFHSGLFYFNKQALAPTVIIVA